MQRIAVCLLGAAFLTISLQGQAWSSSPADVSAPSAARPGVEIGLASWYGEECAANTTATGEPYDVNKLTAAHPSLPLGSWIKVTNLGNHRSVILRVNDRGPFVPGRILDVSEAAARRLGFHEAGLAKVRVELVPAPKTTQPSVSVKQQGSKLVVPVSEKSLNRPARASEKTARATEAAQGASR